MLHDRVKTTYLPPNSWGFKGTMPNKALLSTPYFLRRGWHCGVTPSIFLNKTRHRKLVTKAPLIASAASLPSCRQEGQSTMFQGDIQHISKRFCCHLSPRLEFHNHEPLGQEITAPQKSEPFTSLKLTT